MGFHLGVITNLVNAPQRTYKKYSIFRLILLAFICCVLLGLFLWQLIFKLDQRPTFTQTHVIDITTANEMRSFFGPIGQWVRTESERKKEFDSIVWDQLILRTCQCSEDLSIQKIQLFDTNTGFIYQLDQLFLNMMDAYSNCGKDQTALEKAQNAVPKIPDYCPQVRASDLMSLPTPKLLGIGPDPNHCEGQRIWRQNTICYDGPSYRAEDFCYSGYCSFFLTGDATSQTGCESNDPNCNENGKLIRAQHETCWMNIYPYYCTRISYPPLQNQLASFLFSSLSRNNLDQTQFTPEDLKASIIKMIKNAFDTGSIDPYSFSTSSSTGQVVFNGSKNFFIDFLGQNTTQFRIQQSCEQVNCLYVTQATDGEVFYEAASYALAWMGLLILVCTLLATFGSEFIANPPIEHYIEPEEEWSFW